MNLLVTPMSGKKHIFKMVPGREVPNDQINHKLWFRQNAPIKKVKLVPLDDKNDIALDLLPVTFCSGNLCQGHFSCVEEENERSVTIHLREYDSNLDHINNKYAFVYYGNDTLAKRLSGN